MRIDCDEDPAAPSRFLDITDAEELAAYIRRLRELHDPEEIPVLFAADEDIYLMIAPVGDGKIILDYSPSSDGDWFAGSLDPHNYDGDDATYWFMVNGEPSELPTRFAISEELAMAAVQQFIRHPNKMTMIDGFVWSLD